jgi:hypothetical protein
MDDEPSGALFVAGGVRAAARDKVQQHKVSRGIDRTAQKEAADEGCLEVCKPILRRSGGLDAVIVRPPALVFLTLRAGMPIRRPGPYPFEKLGSSHPKAFHVRRLSVQAGRLPSPGARSGLHSMIHKAEVGRKVPCFSAWSSRRPSASSSVDLRSGIQRNAYTAA